MSEETLRKVFAKNLKEQLEIHDKQPVDLVNDLGIPFSTVSNWVNAQKFPRMGKIELLAHYFGIKKSDLTEEKKLTDFHITDQERLILTAFRTSDDMTKQMVLRILSIDEKIQRNLA